MGFIGFMSTDWEYTVGEQLRSGDVIVRTPIQNHHSYADGCMAVVIRVEANTMAVRWITVSPTLSAACQREPNRWSMWWVHDNHWENHWEKVGHLDE